jgi:hypothetical protein
MAASRAPDRALRLRVERSFSVSTSPAVLRRGAVLLVAVLAALALAIAPAGAADSAPAKSGKPAKAAKVQKPKAQPAAAKAAPVAPKEKPAPKPKPAPPSREELVKRDGPWATQTNWLGVRAGYAKSTADNSGDGLGGYGIWYQHMMSNHWSIGGSVQHDLVSHFAGSYEISVPFTLELSRHFRWSPTLGTYLGVGGGYYFHKYYRSPRDYTGAPGSGSYITFGGNVPVSDRHLLGLDVRTSFVRGRDGVVNPVFGPEKKSETLYSIKLGWAMVY